MVAAATIGLADVVHMPVSTTHVLSSGVAGTMWANRSGIQGDTVKKIGLAWVLDAAGGNSAVGRPVYDRRLPGTGRSTGAVGWDLGIELPVESRGLAGRCGSFRRTAANGDARPTAARSAPAT